MTPQEKAQVVYNWLDAEYNIKEEYIKKAIMPDWWDDEICESGSGYAEFLARIVTGLKIPDVTLQILCDKFYKKDLK